eukprot:1157060-Rhodomonas_salina.2
MRVSVHWRRRVVPHVYLSHMCTFGVDLWSVWDVTAGGGGWGCRCSVTGEVNDIPMPDVARTGVSF